MSTPLAGVAASTHPSRSPGDGQAVSNSPVGSTRRVVPSPLQVGESASRSDSRAFHPRPSVDSVRAPRPAKELRGLDEIRSAATEDVLREKARRPGASSQSTTTHSASTPMLAPVSQLSPPASPTILQSPRAPAPLRHEPPPTMPRNASIDSTVSSVSSSTNASHRPNGSNDYRASQESSSPQDVARMIAAAGSPEAAIQKLINEKNQAASHNAQLWRLVEKQRAMIYGQNKDLDRTLKDKERYKKKLKDHLAQFQSAPSPIATGSHSHVDVPKYDQSRSPAVRERGVESVGSTAAMVASLRERSTESRKASDTSDVGLRATMRSDTPLDASNVPSSVQPGTPRSTTTHAQGVTRDADLSAVLPAVSMETRVNALTPHQRVAATTPISPATTHGPHGSPKSPPNKRHAHQKSMSTDSTSTPLASAQSFSSPKQATRKAPPAPLKLASPSLSMSNVNREIVDASDSEYEDDPQSARAEQSARGRRKTREEDDRDRELLARQEEEYRSRSKKEKKSKSKPPAENAGIEGEDATVAATDPPVAETRIEQPATMATHHPSHDATMMLQQRAIANAADVLTTNHSGPSLLSPGLPMSPRPVDRPINSPMPRAPNKIVNSIPMSLKAGLPLSPRAPRQPIPMPPQTPLAFASPHLARAEAYQQQAQPAMSSIASHFRPSNSSTPDQERPSTSSDPMQMISGEIYQGLVTDQYPDLLLPPNALPSIYVKTASSRMRPSRQSYIAPKNPDENPVFTLAVHTRSDNRQLWRVEKTLSALLHLDPLMKSVCSFRDRVPDKALFAGHAPAKIDARRVALDSYFHRMMEAVTDERAAHVLCQFLSTDAIGAAESNDYFGSVAEARPDTPIAKQRLYREGYLTKRGKNFGGWKARYFVLDGPNLKYFDDLGGAQLGSIKLQNAQIGKQSNSAQNPQEDEENQFRHAFLILEPKKKDSSSLVRHVLCAENDEERDAWVDALLQYVDYRDDEEDQTRGGGVQMLYTDANGPRTPRLQKSLNELRSFSQNKEGQSKPDAIRAVGYNETVAGEAPFIGLFSPRKIETPSPSYEGSFGAVSDSHAGSHPNISGPTNPQAIPSDWGMKPPAPPHGKDKKRSIFAQLRGRSSSDLNDKAAASGVAPQDHYSTGSGRAVFGVPLAEAVEIARPVDTATDLPAVVYRCIEYLLAKNAVVEEGIFRLSGSNTVIKGLKDRFNTEGDVNLAADGTYYDIHAVASLLKLYLRELPSSILTRELHLEFLSCLEMHSQEKTVALNGLANRLPVANYALLQALSFFLLSIVNNADVNKMNLRNVGIVFAPTLNVPGPLISAFVESQSVIFGPLIEENDSPISAQEISTSTMPAPTDLRSPRKQMFQDLPTPAYNQTSFQSLGVIHGDDSTGMIPVHPTYANYQMAPQGDGGYGSINDALRSPTVYNTAANGVPTPRETKAKHRQSGMLGFGLSASGSAFSSASGILQKKSSLAKLREEDGSRF